MATTATPVFDQVGFIMDYEGGELSPLETAYGFAELVKCGLAWTLQGHYGRTAMALIEGGYITRDGQLGPNIDDLED